MSASCTVYNALACHQMLISCSVVGWIPCGVTCCQPCSTTLCTALTCGLNRADRLAVMHEEVVAAVRAQLPPEVQLLDQLVGMRNRCAGSVIIEANENSCQWHTINIRPRCSCWTSW